MSIYTDNCGNERYYSKYTNKDKSAYMKHKYIDNLVYKATYLPNLKMRRFDLIGEMYKGTFMSLENVEKILGKRVYKCKGFFE